MIMFRSTTFASLTILSALVAAPATVLAQAPMNGTVPLAQVGDVVGGGGASLSGGGDDRIITHDSAGAGGGASFEQPGRIATFAGNSGGSPSWTYAMPAPGGIGREARIVGGGENTQVVYIDPTGTRRR
jgi:hypothetical protein